MKKLNYLCVLLIGLLLTFTACNDNQRAKNYNEKTLVDDYGLNFINTVSESGLTEIKASNIALNNSQSQRVKSFAQMMVDDHKKVDNDLTKLADMKYVDKANKINVEHQEMLDGLSKLSDPSFDKVYMEMMVKDHEEATELFTQATGNKNLDVQNFAEKFLPTIKMHLDSAKAINANLK